MLIVKRFVFNPFFENTYLVYDDIKKEAAVIDPGCYNFSERTKLSSFIDEEGLNVKYLINTHCHIDHIFGNSFIKEKYNPIFIAPEEDLFLLDLMIEQGKSYGTPLDPSPKPDELINEKMEICLGKSCGKFIHVPGHSPGGYCLYFENEKICFTGDVLFKESIGRTDLWGGDYNTLIKSIHEKLLKLPDDVKIYPGHELESTIAYEKQNNQFLI
jgi:glyoxylase-like metal-dependent hydrolase (beta-lactamase superfamily II)